MFYCLYLQFSICTRLMFVLSFFHQGRGKPGWGRESTRPVWWPKELPWANVRMDARTEQEKQKVSLEVYKFIRSRV